MIALRNPMDELRRQWRQQISGHRDHRSRDARRGFVTLTFVDRGRTAGTFVDINQISVVLLYEDDTLGNDRVPLRFCCYGVRQVPHGIQWGGADNNRLYKDLTLAPKPGARGRRLDLRHRELAALALRLDRRLSRASRYPAAPWPDLRLPQLWAGFRSRDASGLQGEGPEFEAACRSRGDADGALFKNSARQFAGLTLYPFEWVSGQLERATAVFAEVTLRVRRQLFRVSTLPADLIGFSGAAAFDFYSSRYRLVSGRNKKLRGAGYGVDQLLSQRAELVQRAIA